MAEDHNTQAIEPQSPETVEEKASNPIQEPEKMVSVAEMQRRLKSLEEKHSKDTADAISKALEKYKAEISSMEKIIGDNKSLLRIL